ncbi:MAG: efflux RND transporter permease subunit [Myxococcota bacterium]|jgi:HAE1 family hydrophobic/amphiphilic exporter-1|nr:efflux RND transporter permease subunit [Myxococcota bacterium]
MLLSDVSIKRPVFTTMVLGAIVVFGIVSYPRIGIDMMPNVEFPFCAVTTIYPGASPETVEKEVSEKIEEAVSTISGVRSLRSVSVENVSQVLIEFELEVKADQAVQDVRDRLSRISSQLPRDIESPKVEKLDFGAAPVLTLAVSGPGSVAEVTQFAKKRVKERIQTIPGVGAVDVVGGREREIKVWIDRERLEAQGLSVTDVVNALAASNLKLPGGRLTSKSTEFTVQVDGELKSIDEIGELLVREVNGQGVRVKDVARIEDGFEERRSSALLSGNAAVTLVVRKQSGTNTVAVGDKVKERLAELTEGFPKGWSVFVAVDSTTFTKTLVEHVELDLVIGGVLAVLIVFLFLRNLRTTFIAALALPTSVIGTFIFINALGFTFNTMTLLALSLSIGILIDDAIVVIENIYRHMEEGLSPWEAAKVGSAEIGLAVLATTLSIVAVFVPVAFMQGIIGRFFYQFGITVTVAVLISLFVSFTLTPMLSARLMKQVGTNFFYRGIEAVLGFIDARYRGTIAWALRHRLIVSVIAVLAFSSSIPLVKVIGVEFMTSFDRGELNVMVKMPTGTTLEETERVAEGIAQKVRAHRDLVTSTVMSIGSDSQQKQNLATVYVKMVHKDVRTVSQAAFMARMRREFATFKEANIAVEEVNWMAASGSAMRSAIVQYNVQGGDIEQLERVAHKIAAEMKRTGKFVDVDTTFEAGKPEVRVKLDREKAAGLGVTTMQAGQAVRTLIGGVDAGKYREKGEDYDIVVRLDPRGRQEVQQIGEIKVRSVFGALVPLSNFASVEPGTGPTQIDRKSRQRLVTVLANLVQGYPLGTAIEDISKIAATAVPSEVTTEFDGQARIMGESFRNMIFSLILAIIIVYMVLASQFESFIHPFTIMVSLPLSLVGALGGLLIAKQTLSIMSMIGIIMLMGLVTKNAILLIDYTNTLRRRDGLERNEALLKAGPTRLRPILMTTLAMVFGMMPVALSRGYASEMRAPMAVCVIGGLIASTLLTLVVVPVVYTILDDIARFFGRKTV